MGKTGMLKSASPFRCHLNCIAKPLAANIRRLSVTCTYCTHGYRIHNNICPLSDEPLGTLHTEYMQMMSLDYLPPIP